MKVHQILDQIQETATAGGTSAGNVALGPFVPNEKGKTCTNPDGTAKNALDGPCGDTLMGSTGSVISRNSKSKSKSSKTKKS